MVITESLTWTDAGRLEGESGCWLVLAQKFVVEDRSGQANRFRIADFLAPDDPALAENCAVLLAGNFLRHLEHHFHQRILRQLLRSSEQDPGLAEVFDDALVPGSQTLGAIANRGLQTQASGSWHPARLLGTATALRLRGRLGCAVLTLDSPHALPVVLVFSGAYQTDLIVMAVGSPPRPREFVGAAPKHEYIH